MASLSAAIAAVGSRHNVPFILAATSGVVLAAALGILVGSLTSSLAVPATVGVSVGVFLSLQFVASLVIGPDGLVVLPHSAAVVGDEKVMGTPVVLIGALIIAVAASAGFRSIVRKENARSLTRRGFSFIYGLAAMVSALGGLATLMVTITAQANIDENRIEAQVIAAMLVCGACLYGARGVF